MKVTEALERSSMRGAAVWALMLGIVCSESDADENIAAIEIRALDGTASTILTPRFLTDWSIAGRRDSQTVTVDARDLIGIQFHKSAPTAEPVGMQLLFLTGERIMGNIVVTRDEAVKMESPQLGRFDVPLVRIAGMILDGSATPNETSKRTKQILRRDRQSDLIILKNEDIVRGTFVAMDESQVRIESNGIETSVARQLISAVAMDANLIDYEIGDAFYAQCRMSDGSVINLKSLQTKGNALAATTTMGGAMTVDSANIVDLAFRNGRVVYLADLLPTRVVSKPFFSGSGRWRKDQSVAGGPLLTGGRTYTKGLSMLSYTELEYPVSGFARFEATIGLDDRAGELASARFLVRLDGKDVYDSGEMTVASEPKPIRLSVKGATRLLIAVDYAKRGDVQDFANWCNARLIR